jgi:putative acetyltransferase
MEEEAKPKKSKVEIRYTDQNDAPYLKKWLTQPGVSPGFPMSDEVEVDEAVSRWISFHRYRCSLTALVDGSPGGIATLFLQPYRKLSHQCEMGIVVGEENRGKGIGTTLLSSLLQLAKENFRIELIHLQVYAENPAIRLYRRFGFREFGRQTHWSKENGAFVGRVFMERFLVADED